MQQALIYDHHVQQLLPGTKDELHALNKYPREFIDSLYQVGDSVQVGMWTNDNVTFFDSPKPPSKDDVNGERDRRVSLGLPFDGQVYDHDDQARAHLSRLHGWAMSAIEVGAQPGDYRWADETRDFSWMTQDNKSVLMDAPTALALAEASFSFEASHVLAARTLKDSGTIPEDYADDKHWPASQ